jgi:hypothetical protein
MQRRWHFLRRVRVRHDNLFDHGYWHPNALELGSMVHGYKYLLFCAFLDRDNAG